MSDTPKEQQSAYQRWEMHSFGDERPSTVAKRPPPPEPPTAEDLAAIRDQASMAGFEAGKEAGYADGLALGRAEAAEELAHLKAAALAFSGALTAADETMASDMLELALQLARGMLRSALEVKPELMLPIVREAIGQLTVLQQPALLMLHPQDAAIVMDAIGEELEKGGWRVVQDASVGRGGCKVDTASNQIDAQAATRWQRLTTALGKNHVEWLGP